MDFALPGDGDWCPGPYFWVEPACCLCDTLGNGSPCQRTCQKSKACVHFRNGPSYRTKLEVGSKDLTLSELFSENVSVVSAPSFLSPLQCLLMSSSEQKFQSKDSGQNPEPECWNWTWSASSDITDLFLSFLICNMWVVLIIHLWGWEWNRLIM